MTVGFDIVIVNWNTGSKLRECLQSIEPACMASGICLCQCMVVDNASADGSADSLEEVHFPLEVIKNHENKGFAYACNQGARIGNAEYILFLNPDSKLFPDNLQKSLFFLEKKLGERIGILGIQLVDDKGVVQRNTARFPTPKSLVYQMLGLDRLWSDRFPPHFMKEWNHLENREVDQVEGAFFFVRRQVFEELNGFDERFFMYFEDLDFALRAKKTGWKSYYLADTKAIHSGGGSSNQKKARRLFYILRSRVLYVAKHFGTPAALGILFASVGLELGTRVGWNILNFSWYNLMDTLKAYEMFIMATPQLIRGIVNS